jgi:hypothetical protein
MDEIDNLAYFFAQEYGLTHRAQVNLEAAMRNAVQDGASLSVVEKLIDDVLENVDFIKEGP